MMHPLPRQVLIGELCKFRSRIEDLFETTAVQLFEQLEETENVAALLSRASNIAGGEGQKRFAASIQNARQGAAVLAEEYSAQVSGASDLKRGVRSIIALLEDLKREVRLAAMVATNAQTISRSLNDRQAELHHFALEVKDLLGQALSTIQVVFAEMSTADGSIAPLTKLAYRLREAIFRIESNSRALNALMISLSRIDELPEALRRASSAQARMSTALQKAVADLQGGDAARQRIDHVLFMLETAQAHPSATAEAIEALARAQLTGLTATLGTELASAQVSMSVIAEARLAASDAVRALGSTGVAHTLAQVSVALKTIDADLADIEQMARAIGPEVQRLSQGFERGATAVEAISGFDAQMQLLGINAILVARKVQTNGQAMTEVAKQLRECTARIGGESRRVLEVTRQQERIATNLAARVMGHQAFAGSEIRDMGCEAEGLAKAYVEAVQHLLPATDPFLPRLAAKLAEFSEYAASVTTIAVNDASTVDAFILDEEAGRLIDEIRLCYTMAVEREIHDRLFGRTSVVDSNETVNMAEDDDIFF